MTCPGCNTHSSTVLARFLDDRPCPSCGLSSSASHEITQVRRSLANNNVIAKYEEVAKKVDRAVQRAERLEQLFIRIDEAMTDFKEEFDA